MNTAYLALGSNLGEKSSNLLRALALVQQRVGDVQAVSSFFKSTALLAEGDLTPQPDYLNAACSILTSLAPAALLEELLSIESAMGRIREPGRRWQARIIDLDILSFGAECYELPGLTIPHPQMHTREFVMHPLCQIAPDWVHPIFHAPAQELALRSGDKS